VFAIFVNAAAEELGIKITWSGTGVDEIGTDGNGNEIVKVDTRYFRPTEVETLLGDATKAREKLGWTPKINFKELVAEMVREDLKSAERDELVKNTVTRRLITTSSHLESRTANNYDNASMQQY